jgi:adenylosuccinate synthase
MPLDIIVGTQWGDEGKGRIVDLMASRADLVARYNGGDNAGHTVKAGEQLFKLHLVPSGIIHPHSIAVVGNGTVINPATLLSEISMLRTSGVPITPKRLMLSYAAHMITPAHKALDLAMESHRGKGLIGTTGRGIGPAYTDKAARRGLRMEDMLDTDSFRAKILEHVAETNELLVGVYHAEPLDGESVANEYCRYAYELAPYVADTGALLSKALSDGAVVLAEGAQGTLLDIDSGTYPFVTSSNPTAPGALVGLGIGICPIGRVVGVTKAFQTRVGSGPFPTELEGEMATRLRGTGKNQWDEFGTTTGRPRRVGWLDGVLLQYSARINGLNELAITKLDILSGMEEIKICTSYRCKGEQYSEMRLGPTNLACSEPVYESLPGWQADLRTVRTWEGLPAEARGYIRKIEEISGVSVRMVSVGPERHQIVEVIS